LVVGKAGGKVADMSVAMNAVQAQRWNGDSGRHWIAHRERHATIRQRLTPHLLRAAAIAAGDRVLDVGCGCGETTIAAARAAATIPAHRPDEPAAVPDPAAAPVVTDRGAGQPEGSVLGLDLSGPMLQVARRLAAEAGLTNVRFVQGDAQVHPLPPSSYDVVLSSFGVMFFDNPGTAFTNLLSALRPGGRLALLCWQGETNNELFGIPDRAFLAHTPPPAPADPDLFANPERITTLIAGAGGTDIHTESIREPARLGSDVADVMNYLLGMGRYRRLIAELDDDTLTERALATMAEQYAARQRPNGVWIDAAAWLVRAQVPG
jgi:ubiquinone/menaquinone biosynthesis C-methylase UbiE